MDYIDFHIELFKGDKLTGVDRQQYIQSLAREVKGIDDGVIRNDLVKTIAEKLFIEEHDFIKTVNSQRVNPEHKPVDDLPNEEKIVFSSKVDKAQVELIQLLIN